MQGYASLFGNRRKRSFSRLPYRCRVGSRMSSVLRIRDEFERWLLANTQELTLSLSSRSALGTMDALIAGRDELREPFRRPYTPVSNLADIKSISVKTVLVSAPPSYKGRIAAQMVLAALYVPYRSLTYAAYENDAGLYFSWCRLSMQCTVYLTIWVRDARRAGKSLNIFAIKKTRGGPLITVQALCAYILSNLLCGRKFLNLMCLQLHCSLLG